MNRYSAYKEVDLPWLSEMPQQWCLVRNRDIFTEKTDISIVDLYCYRANLLK